jgi:hypothetical protein
MASSSPSTVFRVTGLPLDKAELDVQSKLFETIRDLLTQDEEHRAGITITCIPSCDDDQTSNALLEFKSGNPKFLLHLDRNPLGNWQMMMGDEDINIDRHFFGFTQLYPTAPGQPVTAEYGASVTIPPRTDYKLPSTLRGPLVSDSFSCALSAEKDRCIQRGGVCDISRDGYYIMNIVCVIISVAKANIRQHHRHNGPGRTRIWVMAGEGQRTNVAPRLPLERSAELSNDDLRLQLQPVESWR